MSILEDLYNGIIRPSEHIYPQNPEYSIKLKEVESLKQSCLKNLKSKDDRDKLERLVKNLQDISEMTSVASFTEGYKCGSLIMQQICVCDGYKQSDLLNIILENKSKNND